MISTHFLIKFRYFSFLFLRSTLLLRFDSKPIIRIIINNNPLSYFEVFCDNEPIFAIIEMEHNPHNMGKNPNRWVANQLPLLESPWGGGRGGGVLDQYLGIG